MSNVAEPIQAAKSGLKKSMKIIILLLKVIIPVSCLVVTLEYFKILEPVAGFFSPAMSVLGLPGEAALVLAFGFFINVFAAIGAMATISLTTWEITTLAVMIGISHELFIESAICRHTGLQVPVSILLRLSVALMAGIFLNILFNFVLGV